MSPNWPVPFLCSLVFALSFLTGCNEGGAIRVAVGEVAPGDNETTSVPGVEPPGVEPPGVEPPGVEPPGVEPKLEADRPFANIKGCIACHQMDAKKIGPSFHSVATHYQTQPDAVSKLTRKVLEGGSGTWGEVAMPANRAMGVTEEDATKLVTWILSLN